MLFRSHQLEQAIHFERAVRYIETLDKHPNNASKILAEIGAFNKLNNIITTEIEEALSISDKALKTARSNDDVKAFNQVIYNLKTISSTHKDYSGVSNEVLTTNNQENATISYASLEQILRHEEKLEHDLSVLQKNIEQFTSKALATANEHEKAAEITTWILIFVSTVLGIFISLVIASRLVSRITRSIEELDAISEGDLSQNISVDGSDEIGALQSASLRMQDKLRLMIDNISQTIELLATASEQLSVSLNQTKANCNEQQVQSEQVEIGRAHV